MTVFENNLEMVPEGVFNKSCTVADGSIQINNRMK